MQIQSLKQQAQLPITKYRQKIIQTISKNAVTIICGETGSGKTTQLPQYIIQHYHRIMISQPRRISAITLAARVALEMGVKLGNQIGYNVRFQEKRNSSTKVTFMTDGMAIRQLMIGYRWDLLILDQAHERSISTDILMAICKEMLKISTKKKNKFKLVIMSATIDSSKFMKYYNTDALINIAGRSNPIEIYNVIEPVQDYLQATYNTVMQIHQNQQDGDILVFMTGEEEIINLNQKVNQIIKEYNLNNMQVYMMYSAIPYEIQHKVFIPKKQTIYIRRIIIATNIAQTSITIPGVKYVIDTGFMKIRTYDENHMMDRLIKTPISHANALQRAGRAGRECAGKCYQLYTKNTFNELEQQIKPQILRSELSSSILQLKVIGLDQIHQLQFMDPVQQSSLTKSVNLLQELKCLNSDEKLTNYGLQISKLPMSPIMAHLLLLSLQMQCEDIMLNVISILLVDNLMKHTRNTSSNKSTECQILMKCLPIKQTLYCNTHMVQSDHIAKAHLLYLYQLSSNKAKFCKQNHINRNNMNRAVQIQLQLKNYLRQIINERMRTNFTKNNETYLKIVENLSYSQFDLSEVRINRWLTCMQKGNIHHKARLHNKGHGYIIWNNKQIAHIHPQSLCFYLKHKPQNIIFSQLMQTNKIYLKQITVLSK